MRILNSFYLAIMNRLIDQVNTLEYFDWWNGQLMIPEGEDDDLPFNFPAVFMEYDPVIWETLGNRRRSAKVSFRLYVAVENYLEKSSVEDKAIQEEALCSADIVDLIYKALRGYNGNCSFGSISITDETPDHDHDQLEIPILSFKTRLWDDVAKPELIPLNNISFSFNGEFYKKPDEEE